MSPFLLPGALALWSVLSAWVAFQAGALFDPALRTGCKALAFAVLLPLPLLDEILAQPQFTALCRDLAVVTVHEPAVPGRGVTLTGLPPEAVPGVMVPVTLRKWLYLDAATGRTVMSFNTLEARAGKLASSLGEPWLSQPLLFAGRCEAGARQRTFEALSLRLASPALPAPGAP